jgi:hypothetical protein
VVGADLLGAQMYVFLHVFLLECCYLIYMYMQPMFGWDLPAVPALHAAFPVPPTSCNGVSACIYAGVCCICTWCVLHIHMLGVHQHISLEQHETLC